MLKGPTHCYVQNHYLHQVSVIHQSVRHAHSLGNTEIKQKGIK